MTTSNNIILNDDVVKYILQYDNRFIIKNGKIKEMIKINPNDERYEMLEKLFLFNGIYEKVYSDYEGDASYIVGLKISKNKKYSIIYDSLNDSRYLHFCEFLIDHTKVPNDFYHNYYTHRSSILIEDY